MIHLLPAPFAVALFAAPLLALPAPPIAAAGAVGLLLAAVGLAAGWRPPLTAAACIFLADYAVAVWVGGGPARPVAALGVGLALVGLLHGADLARHGRRSTVDASVALALLGRWLGLAAAALGAGALAMILAKALASALSSAVAPLLAAGSALGVVATVAALIARSAQGRRGPGR